MRGIVLPYGLVGLLRQAPAGLVGLVAFEPLHRFDRVRKGLPALVEHIAHASLGIGIFRELARGRRVRDVASAGFLEDTVVNDGEADDAADVGFGQAALCCEIVEGNCAVDGHVGSNVVFVDCL